MGELSTKVTPQTFNDLYLPVQWVRDERNPGVLDDDELWVHPTLAAVNAYREAGGFPAIDAQAIAATGIAFLKKPDQAVAHPLLARDLATRMRMRVDFDIEKLPTGPVKEAMKELVKATAFSELYFGLQRDPAYATQLAEVMASEDVMRMRGFWQNAGAGCVSEKDPACTSLPGVARDPNGIWWPNEFTRGDIEALKVEGFFKDPALRRKVLTPNACIVESKEGEVDAFAFKGKWYRPVSINTFPQIRAVAGMMARHIERAAAILEESSPAYAKMLRARAELLTRDTLFGDPAVDRLWIETNHPNLISSFGSVESYENFGSFGGFKSLMQGVVAYVDPALQHFIDAALGKMKETDERLWAVWEKAGQAFPVEKASTTPPRAGVASVVMNGGAMNAAGYVAGGFNQPNYDNYEVDLPRDQMRGKLVYFGPIIAARVQQQGLPLAKLSFDPETIAGLEAVIPDLSSSIAFVQAHEIGHSRAQHDRKKLWGLLGDHLGASMEEAKADLLGLFDIEYYSEQKLITEKQQRGAQLVHFGNMLRCLNLGADDEHGRGAIIEFHLMQKHGVITYDAASGRYHYDQKRLSREIPTIVREYLGTFLSFDQGRIAALDAEAKAAFAGSPMHKSIEALKGQGLPEENLPYYRVFGDLGEY